MNRVLLALITITKPNDPELQLKSLRIRPDTSKVFLYAEQGDISGVQDLLSKGLASIYDVDSALQSLLSVSIEMTI
jgi:hypothetical protein